MIRMQKIRRIGFTLIELLTVIAITAVLLTIIVYPVYQSFNLTRTAQAFAEAQEKGRILTERISREINAATSVRGTSFQVPTTVNGTNTSVWAHSIIVQIPAQSGTQDVVLPWTKLDLILPALSGKGDAANGYVNPVTGKVDPTLQAPRGQVRVPLAAGQTMVRWFVALRDPFSAYNNPYVDYKNPNGGLWQAQSGGRDNLFLLYRAEVVPYVWRAGTKGDTTKAFRPNLEYFQSDATDTQIVDMDDPRFLVADNADSGKSVRIQNWLRRSVAQTDLSRFDMIQPVIDLSSRKIAYDTTGTTPLVIPLVQFRPTLVSNDPTTGQVAVRPGEESNNAAAIAPDVYQTAYGLWNNAVIRSYPAGYLPQDANHGAYEISYSPKSLNFNGDSMIFALPYNAVDEFNSGYPVFDLSVYDRSASLGIPNQFAFTNAALAANTNSGWLALDGARRVFTPFTPYSRQGKVVASFGIEQVGTTPPASGVPNRPTLTLGANPQSAIADNGAGAVYSGAGYDVNRAFNRAWNENTNLQPDLHRFIDLRVVPNLDGTFSPLYPGSAGANTVTGFVFPETRFDTTGAEYATGATRSRVSIVPGTDSVIGPDQLPGPNFGRPVRYVRTSSRRVGPNQYRINYVDQREPSVAGVNGQSMVTAAAYQQALGLTDAQIAGFDPKTYDPTNFVSAVIQPRYKAGYIQLNSDPNIAIPDGYNDGTATKVPITVSYRFQFTTTLDAESTPAQSAKGDVMAVDYDTRQLMQVLLTIRNYAQSSLPNPQQITLKATGNIRNLVR